MNKYTSIIAILLFIMSFPSCEIRDGVDECPEGDVRLHFYVEKFRNKSQDPLSDRESLFCDRVNHIRYYLYHEGALKEQGIVDVFNDKQIGFYTFNYPNLEFGDYRIVVVANSTKTALTGDPSNPDNLVITYPGSLDTEDYFTAVYPFSVTSTAPQEHIVGLSRAHGVVRYTFKNLPEDAVAVSVMMENVGLEKWVTSDYRKTFNADRSFRMLPVTRQSETEEYIMGTFPTLANGRSTFRVGLLREGEIEPYLSQMISDTLTVTRNQLLDLSVTYDNGRFRCEILMDNSWDGSNPGGEIGIQ